MRQLAAFQLEAYPPASLPDAMQAARDLLEASPAMITDIKRYSNKLVVFQLNVRPADWPEFLSAVTSSPLGVERPAGAPAPEQADQDGDVFGTFSVALRGDGDDTRDLIPAVPG